MSVTVNLNEIKTGHDFVELEVEYFDDDERNAEIALEQGFDENFEDSKVIELGIFSDGEKKKKTISPLTPEKKYYFRALIKEFE